MPASWIRLQRRKRTSSDSQKNGCLSYFPVTGVWFSEEGSNPTIGQQGEWSEEPELKVEVNVEDENKDRTVEAIRKVHPYEEPAINAIKLM